MKDMSRLSSRVVGRSVEEIDPESLNAFIPPLAAPDTVADRGSRGSGSGGGGSARTVVALLVAGWYCAAIACITSSKQILLDFPFPLLLCLSQFAVSAGLTFLLRLSGTIKQPKKVEHVQDLPSQALLHRLVTTTSLSYCAGFICTNISFSLVSANFAETVKAGEPISSVLLGYLVLQQSYSVFSCGCLVVICLGVALSCVGTDHFSAWGFFFAVASNFCFSYRAVLAKKLYMMFPDEIDEVTLFSRIACTGCMVLLPLTLFWEATSIYAFLLFPPPSSSTEQGFSGGGGRLLLLLLFNGATYCSYNVLSFFVLKRTDVIVHAILNVCRRMTIIVFTAGFFAVHISGLNAAGVGLALCGVLLFAVPPPWKWKQ